MGKQNIAVWFSSKDGQQYRLTQQPSLAFGPARDTHGTTIQLDPSTTYQSILGIGSSLEEASVYHLARMSAENRERVLKDLVDPDKGIGWNLFRICFGTSDFTGRPYYSYDDLPAGSTDKALEQFSIQKDVDYHIVDIIRQVLALNPEVRIFASPWSPPGWIKSSGSMCGGHLLPQYYGVAARYYRMAIQAYERLGIPIYAFTLQNEPLMVHRAYPTCRFTWQEHNAFLKAVRAEFDQHGIATRIWIFDHNFKDAMRYPARILQDSESYAATDGIAFHSYEGSATAMTDLHNAFPDKDIFFTERSTWGPRGIDEILQYLRNWAKSYNAWVTCLDDRQQPNAGPHSCSPTFVVVNRDDPDDYRYIPEYWLLGQISRFVRRDAMRIESNYGSRRTVTNAAFLNPDGTVALIVVNQTKREQRFTIALPHTQAKAVIPAETVATYVW
jgi:glucosylceramidase